MPSMSPSSYWMNQKGGATSLILQVLGYVKATELISPVLENCY